MPRLQREAFSRGSIHDLIDGEVSDETRAFLYWGWKVGSFLAMPMDTGFPDDEIFPGDLLRILQKNTTLCLEVLEHTFGADDGEDEQIAPLICLSNTPSSKARDLPAALIAVLPETKEATGTAEGLTDDTLELYRLVRQMLLQPSTVAMPLPDSVHTPG